MFCFELKSEKLIELLERGTSSEVRDHRFGQPRRVRPERFGMRRDVNYGGNLYYADRGFPSVKGAGRIANPFRGAVLHISDAKMLLSEPIKNGMPYISFINSEALIHRILSKAFGGMISFGGDKRDLEFKGYYLADGPQYTAVAQLPKEFFIS